MANWKMIIVFAAAAYLPATAIAQNESALRSAFAQSYKYETAGDYAKAESVLTETNESDRYEVNLRLGWLYYASKNYTKSDEYYRAAIKLMPYAIESRLGLINALAARSMWEEVKQQYEAILTSDPQNTTANYRLGMLLYNRKQYSESAAYFEKVANLYPFDYDSLLMLGWSKLKAGRTNEAKVLFNKALLNKPEDASAMEGLSLIK